MSKNSEAKNLLPNKSNGTNKASPTPIILPTTTSHPSISIVQADTFFKRLKGAIGNEGGAIRNEGLKTKKEAGLKNATRDNVWQNKAILIKPAWLGVHTFGMKDDLDVAFLSRDLKVLKISRLVKNRFGYCLRSTSALEAPVGSFKSWGLAVGAQLEIADNSIIVKAQ